MRLHTAGRRAPLVDAVTPALLCRNVARAGARLLCCSLLLLPLQLKLLGLRLSALLGQQVLLLRPAQALLGIAQLSLKPAISFGL